MFCASCGAERPPGARFCPRCGRRAPGGEACREEIPTHLAGAILSTLLCCLPLGIVSIVYAARVPGLVAAGDVAGARQASRSAAQWMWWAVGVWLVGCALWLALNLLPFLWAWLVV